MGALLLLWVAASAPSLAQEPPDGIDPLPPPLAVPEPLVVPPGEEPVLEPRAAPAITFEEWVVELVNQARRENGNLPPLKLVPELATSSGSHSFNMADRDFFAHCDVDTKLDPFQRMTAAGYAWNAAAENLAAGQTDPEDVMFGPFGWMASSGHRANILSTSFREIGVGYFNQPGDQANVRFDQNGDCDADASGFGPFFRYWTQNFGRRDGVFPLVVNRESHDTVCAALKLYVYGPGNATQMRFSNDGSSWSAWETYSPSKIWTIPGASPSPATVFSEVTTGATTFSADDSILLGSGFPAAATLDLGAQTVNGTETFEACDTVSAGDGFEVGAAGDVTFRAGNRVVLRDGFSVASGGRFRALVDPTL